MAPYTAVLVPTYTRRGWIAAGLAAPLHLWAVASELVARVTGDNLAVAAPGLNLLSGAVLERLRNGTPVSFDFHLSLLTEADRSPFRRAFERFTFSYDLWEEKFSVVRRGVLRASGRLDRVAAEGWCLDNLHIPLTGVAANRRFHVRLEVRQADAPEPRADDATGVSLNSLVEIFSRPSRSRGSHRMLETGPLDVGQLKSNGRNP